MHISDGLEPQYVGRFRRRLAEAGGSLARLVYERPTAHGNVRAYLSLPASPRALVVLAHATGNDCLYPQISLMQALTNAGAAVFTFDVDGHGVGSTTLLHPDSLGDAAVHALDQAISCVPGVPVYAVGASLGGLLALKAAAQRPLAGLVVMVAPVSAKGSLLALAIEGVGMVRPSVLRQIPTYGMLNFLPAIGSFRRGAFPVRLAPGLGDGPFAYVQVVERFIGGLGAHAVAATVGTRTLLVYGGQDLIAPVAQGVGLAAAFPHARCVRMPFGTHFGTPLLPGTERLLVNFVMNQN